MKQSEFIKISDKESRLVSKMYGWKQSTYINYKIEKGYFFCVSRSIKESYLEVKPMYTDDLWWDIFDMSENKNARISLRGTGAFQVFPARIAVYETMPNDINSYSTTDINAIWRNIFEQANSDVQKFLTENPDADTYIHDEKQSLLWLMSLLHNGRKDEVMEYIDTEKNKGHISGYTNQSKDGYDFILDWCNNH